MAPQRRGRSALRLAWLGAFALLAACAEAKDTFGEPGSGYVENPTAHLAAADWSRVEDVTVTLGEYAFAPERMDLRSGTVYRLRLENAGTQTHFFASPRFFRAIAARRLTTSAGEIDSPRLESIALAPGESKELLFVPVDKGVYEVVCTVPFHEAFGMEGVVRIL